jgi:hypothetical protein
MEAPVWLRAYESAPWVSTEAYQQRIEAEGVWPLYDLILTTPDAERAEAVASMLIELFGLDPKESERFAFCSVGSPVPLLIGVPKEAMDNAKRRLSSVARLDIIRSVWDRL